MKRVEAYSSGLKMLKVSSIVMLLFVKPSSIFPSQTQSVIQRDGPVEERGGYNRGYT